MNSNDRFITQLESYLDEYEGATPLPEAVRERVRAEVPRTKQTGAARGPVRYLSMTYSKIGPVALAAAAAVLAVAVGFYLFGSRDVGDSTPTPTPTPTLTVSPSASAAAACTLTTITPSAGRLDFAWCSNRTDAPSVPIAFSMDAPTAWAEQFFSDPEPALWLRPPGGGAILVAVDPDRTVDELAADIDGRDGYSISNEADVDLDGASGVTFDLTLADGATAASTEPLIETSQQSWLLSDGAHRVWIVDHDGETVLFAAGEQLVDAATESLSTLTWGD